MEFAGRRTAVPFNVPNAAERPLAGPRLACARTVSRFLQDDRKAAGKTRWLRRHNACTTKPTRAMTSAALPLSLRAMG